MKECKFCSFENSDEAIFCRECGKRVDGKVSCSRCASVESDGTYCENCGSRLDGKTVCECGALVDGNYCLQCGKPSIRFKPTNRRIAKNAYAAIGSENVSTWQKILKIVSASLASFAVLMSLIFVFFIGVKTVITSNLISSASVDVSVNMWNYFGDAYSSIGDILQSLELVDGYSSAFATTLYLHAIFGTVIVVLTLLGVLIATSVAIVSLVRYLLKKSDDYNFKAVAFTVFAFIAGSAAILYLNYNSMMTKVSGSLYGSGSSTTIGTKVALNGATGVGVWIAGVSLLLAYLCAVASNGKKILRSSSLIKTASSLAGCVLAVVCLSFLAHGSIGVSAKESGTSINYKISHYSISSYFSALIPNPEDRLPNADYGKHTAIFVCYIVNSIFLTCAFVVLPFIISRFADYREDSSSAPIVALSVVLLITVIAALVSDVVSVSAIKSLARQENATNVASFSVGNSIGALIFAITVLASSICRGIKKIEY